MTDPVPDSSAHAGSARSMYFTPALIWVGLSALLAVWLFVQVQGDRPLPQQTAPKELQLLAGQIEGRLQAHSYALRSLAAGIESLHGELGSTGYYSNLRRLAQDWLPAVLRQQPDWQTLVAVWRVNAYGEADEVFVGDEEFGSNASGRFANAWQRRGDALASRVLSEAELADWPQRADAAALECAWRQQRLCFASMEDRALLAVPLMSNGKAQGVLGIEIAEWLPAAAFELTALPAADMDAAVQGTQVHDAEPRDAGVHGAGVHDVEVLGVEVQGSERLAVAWQAPDHSSWQLIADMPPSAGFSWQSTWPLLIVLMQLPLLCLAYAATRTSRRTSG